MRTVTSSLVAVAVSAVLVSSSASAAGADVRSWSSPATVSAADGFAVNPQLVVAGNTVAAIWARRTDGFFHIQAATSTDAGITWSTPATLSASGGHASNPQLVVDGSTIVVSWVREDFNGDDRIQAATSSDAGITWSTPVTLSDAGRDAESQQLVTDGSSIIVSWGRFDGSVYRIQAATSADAGITWSTPVTLSAAGGTDSFPQLVVDGTTIVASWVRQDLAGGGRIQAATSTDAGITWSTPVAISAAGGTVSFPQLVTDGSTTVATWWRYVGVSAQIQTATSSDAGITWSTPVTLSAAGGDADSPQLVVDGTTIMAIWSRFDGSVDDRIQTATSSDAGITWSTPVTISAAGGSAYKPQLATDGTTIMAIWRRLDGSVDDRIQTATSSDAGITWSTPVTLSAAGGDADNPQLATGGTTIMAIWSRFDGSNSHIQVSSFTAAEAEPEEVLAATGPAGPLTPSLLAGGLFVSGVIALALGRRHQARSTRRARFEKLPVE